MSARSTPSGCFGPAAVSAVSTNAARRSQPVSRCASAVSDGSPRNVADAGMSNQVTGCCTQGRGARGVVNARTDGFDCFRRQLDRRRRAEVGELARAMAEVDIEFFQEPLCGPSGTEATCRHGSVTQDGLELVLHGAPPPTTMRINADAVRSATITRDEKQAAKEIIEKRKEADVTAARSAAASVRHRPRTCDLSIKEDFDRTVLFPIVSDGDSDNPDSNGEIRSMTSTERWRTFTEEQRKELDARKKDVEIKHFEEIMKRRLDAISQLERRKACQRKHSDYKNDVEDALVIKEYQRKEEIANIRRVALAERAQVAARKRAKSAMSAFAQRQCAIDKTCRLVDVKQSMAEERSLVDERAAVHREWWAERSAKLASRRRLCDAERQVRDSRERDRIAYRQQKQNDQKKRRIQEQREHFQVQLYLKHAMREAANELITCENDVASALPGDIRAYERTLEAMHTLAQGVEEHSKAVAALVESGHMEWSPDVALDRMFAEEPPSITAPLAVAAEGVRQIFAASKAVADEGCALGEEEENLLQHGVELEAQLTAWEPSRVEAAGVEDAPAEEADLQVMPPPKRGGGGGFTIEPQSLAALRRIRRTGPFRRR